ncbi:phospholipase D-like domain-containing protein [Ruegeria denitrificans]|uniref:phospholipase D-like domain-containing protein n=1 Tax=Ruegeria denitrificans TaxID=1715692 RepID=UPI00103D4A99|nr:phospholipase D-like domain-containing protein [Ruegeria denitrificans]
MSLVYLWAFLVTLAQVSLAFGVTVHAVLRKRDTRAVIGWSALAWLAPFVGSLAYIILGVNRINRAGTRMGLSDTMRRIPGFSLSESERVLFEEANIQLPHLAGLARAGEALSAKPLLPGNTVDCLRDGDEAFPEMIAAIDSAKLSVGLLSYIFDSDRAGEEFLNALVRAKDRGVVVRVLIDCVGARYSKENMVTRLEEVGIEAASFLPTSGFSSRRFSNLRNHRKILVVDGCIGFTGGTNIREAHCLNLDPEAPTQCLHFKFEGPVVSHFKQVFVTDWAFTTGEQLSGPAWFPELTRHGTVWSRGISHGPDEDFETLSKLIFAALSAARERVRIVSPYFLPDSRLIEALSVAALRGIKVEIFLPSNNNVKVVEWAAMGQIGQILEHGCRVFFTKPPFDHTKLMLVDDVWALVGSTNWDPRSLRLNFEFNVECYHRELSEELHVILDSKALGAREISLEEINDLPLLTKLRNGFARLLSPYL